jgi:hypothetical protein
MGVSRKKGWREQGYRRRRCGSVHLHEVSAHGGRRLRSFVEKEPNSSDHSAAKILAEQVALARQDGKRVFRERRDQSSTVIAVYFPRTRWLPC